MATITLPYPPTANHLKRIVVDRRSLRGFLVSTGEAKKYRTAVQNACLAAGVVRVPHPEPVCITVHAYRPRRVGDLDNTMKALLDALTGFCFEDDKQIVEIHAHRHEDKHNPRVEVEVTALVPALR